MTDHFHDCAVVGAGLAGWAGALRAACDGLGGELVYSMGAS